MRTIKTHNVLFILLLAIVVSVVAFVLFKGSEVRNYPPKEGLVIAFGDSLVAGVGSEKKQGFVGPLSRLVGEQILNAGVSGNTTAEAIERLDEDVLAHDPSIVFVLLGGNDFIQKVPADDVFKNLEYIITTIQDTGALVVLLGVQSSLIIDRYSGEFESISKDTGSIYVPNILDGLYGSGEFMYDSIHPNDRGYILIAERIYDVLKVHNLFYATIDFRYNENSS